MMTPFTESLGVATLHQLRACRFPMPVGNKSRNALIGELSDVWPATRTLRREGFVLPTTTRNTNQRLLDERVPLNASVDVARSIGIIRDTADRASGTIYSDWAAMDPSNSKWAVSDFGGFPESDSKS